MVIKHHVFVREKDELCLHCIQAAQNSLCIRVTVFVFGKKEVSILFVFVVVGKQQIVVELKVAILSELTEEGLPAVAV